jgi:hypothetical protein
MSTAITPRNSSIPPWLLDPTSEWVSAKEFARLYKRSVRRILEMCLNGDIVVFQVATYQDQQRRWWIRLPER